TARHTDLTADLRVDLGRRDDLVVEHDRHAALRVTDGVTGGLTGQLRPLLAALATEVDVDLPLSTVLTVEDGLGTGDPVALDGGFAELELVALRVGEGHHDVLGVLGGLATTATAAGGHHALQIVQTFQTFEVLHALHLGGQFLGGGLFFPALLGAVGRCAGVVGLSVGCVGEVAGWWFLETLATGFTDAQDGVDGQLCGLADDLGGLRRLLHTGQFDDDPVLTGTRHVRLGHAQAVDALAQHLQDLVGVVGVGDRAVGTVLGLQDDLGAAAQVESQAGRYEPRR